MMHNDGMSQLDLLVKRFSPPLLEVSRDSTEEPNLAPGERVQAHVLANLPNGRFHVLIKDQVLDMNLPSNTQTGDKLDLSVVKTQPRLTFALTDDLQRALPQTAPDVKLSDAVKYLGALLSRATPETPDQVPASVRAEPLLPAQNEQVDTARLADSLKQTLSESGVFFESHQAEWVTGQRSLQSLMREPQAQFNGVKRLEGGQPDAPPNLRQIGSSQSEPPAKINLTDSSKGSVAMGIDTSTLKQATQNPEDQARDLKPNMVAGRSLKSIAENFSVGIGDLKPNATAAGVPNSDTHHPTITRNDVSVVYTQLRDLVQQQLNCLDTRQLTWQGLAWPNQPMEWLVQERQEQVAPGEPEQTVWYSRLHLDLPHLGAVTAAISLQNGMVKVHFQSNPTTAGLLRDNQGRLENQLGAAGMRLLGTTVDDHDESR
ncbi:MAG: flagellar hook-length control protein FliK [Chitinivorax sp.]